MALFVVFIYLKAWFNSPSLTSAAKNDLELYKLLLKFKKIHSKISQSACEVLNRHTWYLTEDAITLTLFNEDICTEQSHLHSQAIPPSTSDRRNPLADEEEDPQDGSICGIHLPEGVVQLPFPYICCQERSGTLQASSKV